MYGYNEYYAGPEENSTHSGSVTPKNNTQENTSQSPLWVNGKKYKQVASPVPGYTFDPKYQYLFYGGFWYIEVNSSGLDEPSSNFTSILGKRKESETNTNLESSPTEEFRIENLVYQ